MYPIDVSKFPSHIRNLIDNTLHIGKIVGLRPMVIDLEPRDRQTLEVINKSALVLLVASWEAYIEDLATHAFDFLLANASSPSIFPKKVLALSAKHLRDDKDETRIWELAEQGWKNVLQQHRNEILSEYVGSLNTPRPRQVNELFEKLIGLRNLSASWKWRGKKNEQAINQLEKLITRRGNIAHKVTAGTYVTKQEVFDTVYFVQRIATISSNRVRGFILKQTNMSPWIEMRYGFVT